MNDINPDDLTQFKIDILAALVDGPMHGLGIVAEIEEYYGEGINASRLYMSADELIDAGLISKEPLDGRTNEFELTEAGARVLKDRQEWLTPDATDQSSQYWCEYCGHGPKTSVALLSHHGEAHPDREPSFVQYDPQTREQAVTDGSGVDRDGG